MSISPREHTLVSQLRAAQRTAEIDAALAASAATSARRPGLLLRVLSFGLTHRIAGLRRAFRLMGLGTPRASATFVPPADRSRT